MINTTYSKTPQLMVDDWCCSRSNMINHTFKWTIDNFLSVNLGITSSVFSLEPKHTSKWRMQIFASKDDTVEIYLNLLSLGQNEKCVNGRAAINLLSSKGEKKLNYHCTFPFLQAPKHVDPWTITRECIQSIENDVLPNGKLIILVELEILSTLQTVSGLTSKDGIEIPEATLPTHLNRLLETKKFSDVTLVADGKEFPVHKLILIARSDVFAAMFEHNLEEQKSNRVDITDINSDVLQKMIEFIYTGQDPNVGESFEITCRLCVAADKYALQELKCMCERAMLPALSIENAAEALFLADLHNLIRLKMKIFHFFNENAKEIISTDGWKKMKADFPGVVIEVYEALYHN